MTTFALFFGNRAFMPSSVIDEARTQLKAAVEKAGCDFICMDVNKTFCGAAQTVEEGRIYAEFLAENKGKFDGVIACLANFSDESATVEALKDCNVPILIQACPDEIGKMDFAHRRDAFCGKLAITDLLCQYDVPFSLTQSHVVALDSDEFQYELTKFAAVCRAVKSTRNLTVAAIGARTSAFKTMRYDEITAQKYGITIETIDLSDFFMRMEKQDATSKRYKEKLDYYLNYADCKDVPDTAIDNMVRASLTADDISCELNTNCMTIRCWDEFQKNKNICVCNLISELNNRGIITACELDLSNAIAMNLLSAASGNKSACLDFNNNYGDDKNKCILFHCGSIATDLMRSKGRITEHKMFQKTMGDGVSWGVNKGHIKAMPITYASTKTSDGKIIAYVDKARITDDTIEDGFFGTGGVAYIQDLQAKMLKIARNGFRHHVSITEGDYAEAVKEACQTYLKFDLIEL